MTIEPAVSITGIEKSFVLPRPIGRAILHPFERKRLEVLRGVDLRVECGIITGLLGPNGAGKTTLLRILAGSILPDRGSVRILGLDPGRKPLEVKRKVGFVHSDERSFFWRLTALQNLVFFGVLCDMEWPRARRRARELAGLLEIENELDKPFRDLSTGMRQRLGIARALMHDPELLLVDEPTRALDPGAARRIRRLIADVLVNRMGKTVLLASHQLEEVREICGRVIVLRDGRVAASGGTEEILSREQEFFDR